MAGGDITGSQRAVGECVFPSKGPFPIAQAVLTVHVLYDLPCEMKRLHAMFEHFAVALRPVVKYYYRGSRLISIPLGEHVLPFATSAVRCRESRLAVDLDAIAAEGLSMPRSACWHEPAVGSSGTASAKQPISGREECEETKRRGEKRGNQIHMQFPRPEGLTTHIDVVVGLNLYRKGSCTNCGAFGSFDSQKFSEGVGYFSVSTKEVNRRKMVTRVVGLSVGCAICSISVSPHDKKDDIARRLAADRKTLAARCSDASAKGIEAINVSAFLRDGVAETDIYHRLLLIADPNYYVKRLNALFTMYPLGGNAECKRNVFSDLLAEREKPEEEVMRRAIVEFGPECCNVSTRHRLLAFRKKYSLSDHDMRDFFSDLGVEMAEVFDVDTEILFAALTKAFGKEPRPTSYLFSVKSPSPLRPALVFEKLHMPTRSQSDNYRDAGLASRFKRPPFTMSSSERPLHLGNDSPTSKKKTCEIEVLREKYAPEFAQIVPSIADAILAVVKQNASIQQSTVVNDLAIFDQPGKQPHISFKDFVHRIAEYAYISPSSLLGAGIYLDRLCVKQPNFVLSEQNVFRLFLTSVRVSSKLIELRSISNRQFASMFGVELKWMNVMEEVFLRQLDFDLFVTPQEFREYARLLQPPASPRSRESEANANTNSECQANTNSECQANTKSECHGSRFSGAHRCSESREETCGARRLVEALAKAPVSPA